MGERTGREQHITSSIAVIRELEALRSLRNEACAILGLARSGIVALVGETNVRCLERRMEEAEQILREVESMNEQEKTYLTRVIAGQIAASLVNGYGSGAPDLTATAATAVTLARAVVEALETYEKTPRG